MLRSSIRTKILTIAVGLIVLMTITAALSLTLVTQVGHRLEQLTNSYIPAYGDLARANIRSLERALALRRMVIAKTQSPPDQVHFSAVRDVFDAKGAEAVREGQSARALINGLIEQGTSLAVQVVAGFRPPPVNPDWHAEIEERNEKIKLAHERAAADAAARDRKRAEEEAADIQAAKEADRAAYAAHGGRRKPPGRTRPGV